MSVAGWNTIGTKQRGRIVTSDPSTRRIEVLLKDGSIAQVAVWEVPSIFRWPQADEIWTIVRDNGYWRLGEFMATDDGIDDTNTTIDQLNPGDALIHTGNVFTPDGHQFVRSYTADVGDGTNTSYVLYHGLDTMDVMVSVRKQQLLTTLTEDISDDATQATVFDTTGFTASGLVYIESERISYSSTNPDELLTLTRGLGNTIARVHTNGTLVIQPVGYVTPASLLIIDENRVVLGFGSPPTEDQYRAAIIG